MKISLRKAAIIQDSIRQALHSINVDTTVDVSEFTADLDATLAEAVRTADANFALKSNLLTALCEIRTQVSDINGTAGVNRALAEMADLDARIKVQTALTQAEPMQDMQEVVARLKKPVPSHVTYHREAEVRVNLFSKERLASFKSILADLRRRRQAIKDSLLEINIKHDIALSDTTVATLRQADLL